MVSFMIFRSDLKVKFLTTRHMKSLMQKYSSKGQCFLELWTVSVIKIIVDHLVDV